MLAISALREISRLLKAHAPDEFSDATERLRSEYRFKLRAATNASERDRLARRYQQDRSAMMLRLAAFIIDWS